MWGKPGQQYTGALYAPLMPALLVPLYRVFWWDGWAPLVSTFSGIGLATLVGGVAASGHDRPTWRRAVGGVGLGGVAFWIVTTNPWHAIYTGRVDELAWLFAMSGLCVLALSVAHHWTRIWPVVLLLTAAMWTKQPTAAAAVAAVAAAAWWAYKGLLSWRSWRQFVAWLALVNVVLLAAMMALTEGWNWFNLVELADAQTRRSGDRQISHRGRTALHPPRHRGHGGMGRRMADKDRARIAPGSFVSLLATVLIAFLVIQFVPAFVAVRLQGNSVNEFIGMMWALALLLALAHREAHWSPRALTAGIFVYAAIFVVLVVRRSETACGTRTSSGRSRCQPTT